MSTKTQADVIKEEAQLSATLRASGQELVDRAHTLQLAIRDATEILAPALEEVVAVSLEPTVGKDGLETGPSSLERVERAVNLISKIAIISKTAAETAEKIIKLERQVRGEPTESFVFSSSLPVPETAEQLQDALALELAAMKRADEREQN